MSEITLFISLEEYVDLFVKDSFLVHKIKNKIVTSQRQNSKRRLKQITLITHLNTLNE